MLRHLSRGDADDRLRKREHGHLRTVGSPSHPLGRPTPGPKTQAAKVRRRQLWTAFGISSGVAVAGLTTWVTPLFVPACEPFYNQACGAAAVSGAAILAVGSGGMVSTGMALLLHRIHRHREVEVEPGVAGLSVRF